jgi:hypothetical protein
MGPGVDGVADPSFERPDRFLPECGSIPIITAITAPPSILLK